MWEASATKTYPTLKTFFHEVYGLHLTAMALRSTSGQNGYTTQNMYIMLEGNDDTNEDMVTAITQTAASTTTTGTTPHVRPAVNADISTVINQLAANQTAIMLQMVAMSFAQSLAQHNCQYVPCNTFQVPPIEQVACPCRNTCRRVTSTQGVGGIRAVEAVDTDGADDVVTHLQTTCNLRELCRLCLANSSLMEEAWHRSHPLLVCINRIATRIS
jgi:hypothetical protein